uniref:Uncharacterized protein n=1 Tax=Anguilla anguilla TaxID=7936 RepID=A0A0E9QGW3_ANGAN
MVHGPLLAVAIIGVQIHVRVVGEGNCLQTH